MKGALAASALLHALALGGLLARPAGPAPQAGAPARLEVVFAPGGTPAPPSAAARPAPPPDESASGPPPDTAAEAQPAAGRPGVRPERADPTLVPARDDPANAAPAYPPAALRRRVQGTVLLRLHIGADGAVTQAELLRSSGDADLDRAAQTTLARWHFLPAARHGVNVPWLRDQPVRFAIE